MIRCNVSPMLKMIRTLIGGMGDNTKLGPPSLEELGRVLENPKRLEQRFMEIFVDRGADGLTHWERAEKVTSAGGRYSSEDIEYDIFTKYATFLPIREFLLEKVARKQDLRREINNMKILLTTT